MNNLIKETLTNEKQRAEFKRHFLIYILVVVIFWVVWAVGSSGHVWPVWPTLGWGIGVLVHYIRVNNDTHLNEI